MRWVEIRSPKRNGEKKIDQVIARYQGRHGCEDPLLKETQEICGYLPKNVQHRIAEGLSLSSSQVYGVVSFYAFFTTIPRGKHIIRVCLGTACYVKGSKQILDNPKRTRCRSGGDHTRPEIFSGSSAMPWSLRFGSGHGHRA